MVGNNEKKENLCVPVVIHLDAAEINPELAVDDFVLPSYARLSRGVAAQIASKRAKEEVAVNE